MDPLAAMKIDPHLRRQALNSAVSVLEMARDPASVLAHIFPVYEAINTSPLGEITRQRLLEDPQLRSLAAERYQGPWPSEEAMAAMPAGSLGQIYQRRFERLGLHQLELPQVSGMESDGDYLQRRRLLTHDIHHTVLASGVSPAKREEAMAAMHAGSLGQIYQRRSSAGLHQLELPQVSGMESDGDYCSGAGCSPMTSTTPCWPSVRSREALPVSVAGEAAGAAYFSSALNEFGPAVVLTAWMFHAMETPAERDLIWVGIRFGLELAECLGPRLLAMRWEQGWQEPIALWRERLGVTQLLARTPFPEELALLS